MQRAASAVPSYPAPLPQAEQRALVAAAQGGNTAARDRLIATNMRLVALLAWKAARGHGVAVGDLLNAGALGLTRAIQKFDLAKPYHFNTYASWWVRSMVTRAAIEAKGGKHADSNKYERQRRMVALIDEGNSPERAAELLAAQLGHVQPYTLLGMYRRFALRWLVVSLHDPVGGEGQQLRQDTIAADGPLPDELVGEAEARQEILQAVLAFRNRLSARNRAIFDGRFWPPDGETVTLQELGDRLDLSRERIRQIETKLRAMAAEALGPLLRGGAPKRKSLPGH